MSLSAKRQKIIHGVTDIVDSIKEKLTDIEYKRLVESLGSLYKVEQEEGDIVSVRITYVKPDVTLTSFLVFPDEDGSVELKMDARPRFERAIVHLSRADVDILHDQIKSVGYAKLKLSKVNGDGSLSRQIIDMQPHSIYSKGSNNETVDISFEAPESLDQNRRNAPVVFIEELGSIV